MSDQPLGGWFVMSETTETHGVDIDLPARAGDVVAMFEALQARRTVIIRERKVGRKVTPVEVTEGYNESVIRMAFTVTTRTLGPGAVSE